MEPPAGRPAAAEAGRLLTEALEIIGNRPSTLDAQAHLTGFYARYGYEPCGPEFLEDGIPHVPMFRPTARPVLREAPRPAR